MYGDTLVMRKRAGQLREQSAEIRAAADQLVARSEAIPWRGRAAEAMRERVKERASHLRAAARAHETAADSLARHLGEVDRLKEAISETESKLGGRVAEAQHRVEASAYDPSAATEHDRALAAVDLPPAGHADWLTSSCRGADVPTIDLSTPPPARPPLLDELPRRLTLTLPELRVAAAPPAAPRCRSTARRAPAPGAPWRTGWAQPRHRRGPGVRRRAGLAARASRDLPPAGLLVDDRRRRGAAGAVGLLATPEVALDLDLAAGDARARAWHRQAGGAVATLATVDGVVFELAWFARRAVAAELARAAVLPEDLPVAAGTALPDVIDVPFELLDAAGEAVARDRPDLLPVLAARHSGTAWSTSTAVPLASRARPRCSRSLAQEARGRLRALVADVSGEETTVVGVVSWVLLADGWHALRPHRWAASTASRCAASRPRPGRRAGAGAGGGEHVSDERARAPTTEPRRRSVAPRRPLRRDAASGRPLRGRGRGPPRARTPGRRGAGRRGGRRLRAALAAHVGRSAEAEVRAATTGRHGLLDRSVELDADALVVRATVLTYRWIDELQTAAYETLGCIAGRAIGYLAPEVALGGAIVSAGLIETDALDREGVAALPQRARREQPRADGPRQQRRRRAARRPAAALAADGGRARRRDRPGWPRPGVCAPWASTVRGRRGRRGLRDIAGAFAQPARTPRPAGPHRLPDSRSGLAGLLANLGLHHERRRRPPGGRWALHRLPARTRRRATGAAAAGRR